MVPDFERWCRANLTITAEHGGGEVTAVCPRCGRPKLAVNLSKRAWQCWTCRYVGRRPDALVEAVTGKPSTLFAEDAPIVRTEIGEIGPLNAPNVRDRHPTAPLPGKWRAPTPIQARYLELRGVPDSYVTLFGVGSVTDDGTRAGRLLSDRVIIPVLDNGRRIYWTARATLSSATPKTLNCPAPTRLVEWGLPDCQALARKSEVLLGLHLCSPRNPLVLVEGPLDALVCGPGFVSTLGAGLSEAQAALLTALAPSEVVVLFDPDEAGREGAATVCQRLGGLLPVRVAQCPPETDPADLGRLGSLKVCQAANPVRTDVIRPL